MPTTESKDSGARKHTPAAPGTQRIQFYIDEERDARLRLARYKAKLYAQPQNASPASQHRLDELRLRWEFALRRLREAKARAVTKV